MERRVAIVGLGLIGGSIGLALRHLGADAPEIVGYARREETVAKALSCGAIDRAESSLAKSVQNAGLVIVATPILATRDIFAEIGPQLMPGCVVTDTGSTKASIIDWAAQLLPDGVEFVGGHPMAGKETSGIDVAEPGLFRGCTYCIVPGRNSSPASVELITDLAREIGARPLLLSAAQHDRLVAGISHLPFTAACALVMTTMGSQAWSEMSGLAATGYRDTSRLVSQDPTMTRDICVTNRENIVLWIDRFIRELERIRDLVADGGEQLGETLSLARRMRQEWLQQYEKRSQTKIDH